MKYLGDQDLAQIFVNLGTEKDSLAGISILFTGGNGFLGNCFREFFEFYNANSSDSPVRVTLVDNFISSASTQQRPDSKYIKTIRGDVLSLDLTEDFDLVVHAAGIASPFHYRAHPLETLEVAVSGTRRMLEFARKRNSRFVFFSSSEIYGDPDPAHVPTPESYRGNVSCQGPRACYDESKRLGETLCYIFHESFGLHTNTIRPFNVFGPGMRENDYRVLPSIASALKGNRVFKAYGTGNQTRTYTYITDALNGFFRVFTGGVAGEAYNIGTTSPEISVNGLVEVVRNDLSRDLKVDVVEHPDSYPADEPQRRCPDIRKAREQLGFDPSVDLVAGLDSFFRWTDHAYTGVQ